MKKVFILYTNTHSKYLVGYCTNFTDFVSYYFSNRSQASKTAELNPTTNMVTYKTAMGDTVEMWCETIRDNETCFMKSIE